MGEFSFGVIIVLVIFNGDSHTRIFYFERMILMSLQSGIAICKKLLLMEFLYG